MCGLGWLALTTEVANFTMLVEQDMDEVGSMSLPYVRNNQYV
jgi:hypothetical protein